MWNDEKALNHVASGLFALAVLLLLCAAGWRIAQMEAFALREIRITTPVEHVTREQVEAVVFSELKGNFFTVNLAATRTAFEKLSWVRRVDVNRRWPDRVEIAVEEHAPIARWGDAALVNAYGEVFEGASSQPMPVFDGPLATAPEVVARHAAFEHKLAAIGRTVDRIRVSERHAWRIRLDDGMVIELGRDDVEARLAAFASAFDRTVATLPGGSAYVDLRYPNGFAVRVKGMRWNDGPA
ncbi:MAG TPA: cell division protein FtsQ/DivIB [Burkholderiales bacterium]|nr:cell division protein FtsQ/DivIB [Burkholderiales bacterium]